jgi:hypothetical protein
MVTRSKEGEYIDVFSPFIVKVQRAGHLPCPFGCCDANGTCPADTKDDRCGKAGTSCQNCTATGDLDVGTLVDQAEPDTSYKYRICIQG